MVILAVGICCFCFGGVVAGALILFLQEKNLW